MRDVALAATTSPFGETARLVWVPIFCRATTLLVGKWECTDEGKDKGMVVEFTKDGTSSMAMGPITHCSPSATLRRVHLAGLAFSAGVALFVGHYCGRAA